MTAPSPCGKLIKQPLIPRENKMINRTNSNPSMIKHVTKTVQMTVPTKNADKGKKQLP